MLLKALIDEAVAVLLVSYPEREAKQMVYECLESIAGTGKHTHILEPAYEVSDDVAVKALESFRRMAAGEPLQYVLGYAYFYGRRFSVSPDVLIPRPETELLCRYVLDRHGDSCAVQDMPPPARGCPRRGRGSGTAQQSSCQTRILDLCTGSGCIAWTLALEMPGSEVTAVDISQGALRVSSSQNFTEEISRTGAHAPEFIKTDVLGPCPFEEQFDIIVSNPPYVMDKEKSLMRSNVLDHEPHLALFVSDDDPLIFYRAIARWSQICLKSDGYGIVEINEALGPETAAVFQSAGFEEISVLKDLSDKDRFVKFKKSNKNQL